MSDIVKPIVFGTVNTDMSILVNNGSDDETGFIYEIHCQGEVTNPFIYLAETNQFFKINKRFGIDSVITIDTRRGNKYVTVDYHGTIVNIINYMDNTSKWIQLQSGFNHITQGAEAGAEFMDSTLKYVTEYEGV